VSQSFIVETPRCATSSNFPNCTNWSMHEVEKLLKKRMYHVSWSFCTNQVFFSLSYHKRCCLLVGNTGLYADNEQIIYEWRDKLFKLEKFCNTFQTGKCLCDLLITVLSYVPSIWWIFLCENCTGLRTILFVPP
jgi:hypothetical protein